VLVLQSDQHNYRFLGHHDDERGAPVHTPAFDDLAASAAVFEEAYCPVPQCTPSRLCTLSSRRQPRCGAWDNEMVLFPEYPSLPAAFSDAGYETGLIGKMHLGGDRQFVGFDKRPYGDLTGKAGHQNDPPVPHRSANEHGYRGSGVTEIPESLLQETNVVRETLTFLREQRHADPDQPWLAWASFSRPHTPFTAPRRHFERYWPDDVPEPPVGWDDGDFADHPYSQWLYDGPLDEDDARMARAAYYACVDYLDEVIGELMALLDREGFLENTIVVYCSDHGDHAGEHGIWHKGDWPEGSTHVPLYVQLPEHRDGTLDANHISTPVSLVDLFPTLTGLTGLDAPDDIDGEDLSAAIESGTDPDRGPVVSDRLVGGHQWRMVRDGRYKYVHFRDFPSVLYDLAADPFETENLAPDATGEDAAALDRLRSFVEDTIDYAALDEQRERDLARAEEFELSIPKYSGEDRRPNLYHMPDGRLVGADTPLYKPDLYTDDPAAVFSDWPETEPE
jgi:choline-sulfatase